MIEKLCLGCGRASAERPCRWCLKLEKRLLKVMQKHERIKRSQIKREGKKMTQFNINDRVQRTVGADYETRNLGTVVELDLVNYRARVMWDPPKNKRTWMRMKALKVVQ